MGSELDLGDHRSEATCSHSSFDVPRRSCSVSAARQWRETRLGQPQQRINVLSRYVSDLLLERKPSTETTLFSFKSLENKSARRRPLDHNEPFSRPSAPKICSHWEEPMPRTTDFVPHTEELLMRECPCERCSRATSAKLLRLRSSTRASGRAEILKVWDLNFFIVTQELKVTFRHPRFFVGVIRCLKATCSMFIDGTYHPLARLSAPSFLLSHLLPTT